MLCICVQVASCDFDKLHCVIVYMQELLKHTPGEDPDYRLITAAVDKLHEGLIRLNHSIKLCLLASSVQQVQNQKSLRGTRKLTSHRFATSTTYNISSSL